MTNKFITEDDLIILLKKSTKDIEARSDRINKITTVIQGNGTENKWIAASLARKVFLEVTFIIEKLQEVYTSEAWAGDHKKLGVGKTADKATSQAAAGLIDAFLREESPLGEVPESDIEKYSKIIKQIKLEVVYLFYKHDRIPKLKKIVNKHWIVEEAVKYIAEYNYVRIVYNNIEIKKYQGLEIYIAEAIAKGTTFQGIGQSEKDAKTDLNFIILDQMIQDRLILGNHTLEHPRLFILPPMIQ